MALAASLQHLSERTGNSGARVLADALDAATGSYLDNARSPSPRVGELDNRGSTFYLTLYWARALAEQQADGALARRFAAVARALAESEARILEEIDATQGSAQDLGGYYMPAPERVGAVMRPSGTLNRILASV
jgi:isocitrate dehydrogenase